MVSAIENNLTGLTGVGAISSERLACFHCGEICEGSAHSNHGKLFCCQGCLTVHDLLTGSGLAHFYALERNPGIRVLGAARREQWSYLDQPELARQLVDFADDNLTRLTFHIPAIHCIACVWLLENLFRLHSGIGQSRVNFQRREVAISFKHGELALSQLVALLASIGYEPRLTLGELNKAPRDLDSRRRWLQVGIAGFAFGNIMLFSLPEYLGLDRLSGSAFKTLFGSLSLGLALPVLVYSASDYWRAALLSLRQRVVTLDVPIALGLAALYGQSAWEILSARGPGYLDSLSGLVFFLLCGRVFQQKTHDRLVFDRDYKCFFPLSVVRKTAQGEESIAISNVRVGDRLLLRHGELIPADGRLVSGPARIDYSFVTGESEPVAKVAGDYLYSGGQQAGGAIELETVKPVSQSYLTSLWNHEAFQKKREDGLNTITNRYSRRFTRIVIAVALGAACFWVASGEATRGLKAFTSVLIVACPCALALAAPFTLGTAQRLLARGKIFLKNALVLERMAQVDCVVFDKTGTLTVRANTVAFHAEAGNLNLEGGGRLSPEEASWVFSLTKHSTHPYAVRIHEFLKQGLPEQVRGFTETPGSGIEGIVAGHELWLGSRVWLAGRGIAIPDRGLPAGSWIFLAIDREFRGTFVLSNSLRPETGQLFRELNQHYELALLSGDNEREAGQFRQLFGGDAHMHFDQTPIEKLGFIRQLQDSGRKVMMVGDGLNDAGALKQSDVGAAVVEKFGAFSPASDVILDASQITNLHELLAFARKAALIVRVSFGVSALYNLAGISIAAAGILSPLICAVLMPLSSVSVVLFVCAAAQIAARKTGLRTPNLT